MRFIELLSVCLFLLGAALPGPVCRAEEESIEEMLATRPPRLKVSLMENIVGRTVVEMLSLQHYQNYRIDPEMSSRWFQEYFKSLDYAKIYFLESDLEAFRSHESILWNYRTRSVDVDFAFAVYERYLERVRQWAEFCVKYLADPPKTFDRPESISLDDRNTPWCRTSAELEDRWRRRCDNSLLANLLQEEKDKAKAKAGGKDGGRRDGGGDGDREARRREDRATEFDYRRYRIHRYLLTVPEDRAGDARTVPGDPGKAAAPRARRPPERKDPYPLKLAKNIARNYRRRTELGNMEVLEIYLSSLCRLYDPHTCYMAPETKDNFDINMSLSLQGIGAVLTAKGAYVTVVDVIPGGPADLDGRLKKEDRIVAVAQDGKETVDVVDMSLTKVVARIRGPKGSVVHLTVLPEGSSTERTISLRRDEVRLQDQEAQAEAWTLAAPSPAGRPRRCLTIYLPSFYSDFAARSKGVKDYKSSSRDIARLIADARRDGPVDALVLDLRGNGGGSLSEAVELAGLFLEGGPVVQVKSFNGQIVRYGDPDRNALYLGPLVVLVDKFSASASEIVSSCLQDTGRAVVVGERSTHGKGTVQNLMDLSRTRRVAQARMILRGQEPGSLKFTTQKYYRINGSSTQERGVVPDIVLPSFTDHMELGEARLPNVLPWDEISTSRFKVYPFRERTREALKRLFLESLDRNPLYRELLADIRCFAEFRRIKELPIDRRRRLEYQAREEKAGRMLQRFRALRRIPAPPPPGTAKTAGDDPDPDEPHDLMMDTTIDVLMQWLQTAPAPAAAASAATAAASSARMGGADE